MGWIKIIKKVGFEIATALASFGLGYFAGDSDEKVDSNDQNSGVINNEIKIVEKEQPKEHIEYLVYIIAAIVLVVFLVKCVKHIKAKILNARKQINTRENTEEHELEERRFAQIIV